MGDFGRMVYWVDDRTQSGRATMEGIVLSLVSMVEVGRGIVEAVGEVLRWGVRATLVYELSVSGIDLVASYCWHRSWEMAEEAKRCVIGVLEGDSTTPSILRSLIQDIHKLQKDIRQRKLRDLRNDTWKKQDRWLEKDTILPSTWGNQERDLWAERNTMLDDPIFVMSRYLLLTRSTNWRKSSLYTPQSLALLHCLRHNLSIISTCFWILSEITSISSLCLNTSSCCMFVLIYLFCRSYVFGGVKSICRKNFGHKITKVGNPSTTKKRLLAATRLFAYMKRTQMIRCCVSNAFNPMQHVYSLKTRVLLSR